MLKVNLNFTSIGMLKKDYLTNQNSVCQNDSARLKPLQKDVVSFTGKPEKTDAVDNNGIPLPKLKERQIIIKPNDPKIIDLFKKYFEQEGKEFGEGTETGKLLATFNPGVIKAKDKYVMLLRCAVGEDYPPRSDKTYIHKPFVNYLVLTESKDGKNFEPKKVLITPDAKNTWGYEDPRITYMPNEEKPYYITATGFDGKCPRMTLFKTKDFDKLEGPISVGPNADLKEGTPDYHNKDHFFIKNPKGETLFFHRPYTSEYANIHALRVKNIDDLKNKDFWKKNVKISDQAENTGTEKKTDSVILNAINGSWQNRIGGGAAPIETDKGFLMIYHGTNYYENINDRTYCAGVALLDKNDPTKLIAKAPYPFIKSELPEEKEGCVINVIFPSGNIKDDKGNIIIYYGAADENVGSVKVNEKELLDYVLHYDENGKLKKNAETK
ncbi:MAG: hypothetical protein A2255_04795 [Candidatus Melainabacteria bacterium RIFOXYA2_FULL_32_9]|nr:MAG: hypothetical protein A2255_04795 [Candidatus Melainabacteria bacterium RIFOXYA2_FULL_32_9]